MNLLLLLCPATQTGGNEIDVGDFLLLENNDYFLLENNNKILLES